MKEFIHNILIYAIQALPSLKWFFSTILGGYVTFRFNKNRAAQSDKSNAKTSAVLIRLMLTSFIQELKNFEKQLDDRISKINKCKGSISHLTRKILIEIFQPFPAGRDKIIISNDELKSLLHLFNDVEYDCFVRNIYIAENIYMQSIDLKSRYRDYKKSLEKELKSKNFDTEEQIMDIIDQVSPVFFDYSTHVKESIAKLSHIHSEVQGELCQRADLKEFAIGELEITKKEN